MQVHIPSPKHYENYHGESPLVRAYLDRIEKTMEEELRSDTIGILRISLLIATPEELADGKFLAYEKYDWRCAYAAVGVNGDFERYHTGDDLAKICELSEMLQHAFLKVGKKRKAGFDAALANEIVSRITRSVMEHNQNICS
jgi:hypothetical protein